MEKDLIVDCCLYMKEKQIAYIKYKLNLLNCYIPGFFVPQLLLIV